MHKDKGHVHCLCGQAFAAAEAAAPEEPKKAEAEWAPQKVNAVQELVDQLARLTGTDIQKALVCHLPLPHKLEERECPGEGECFGQFRNARAEVHKAGLQKSKANKLFLEKKVCLGLGTGKL